MRHPSTSEPQYQEHACMPWEQDTPRVPPKGGDVRKHGGTPSRLDKYVTLAAISPPGVARGCCVRGHQSGLAGRKLPPLFKRGASSCSSQRQRQREPWGASPRPSAPTYLPRAFDCTLVGKHVCSREGVLGSNPTTPKLLPNVFAARRRLLRNAP